MTVRTVDDPLTQPSPPEGGEGFIVLSPLPVGEGWVRALFVFLNKTLAPSIAHTRQIEPIRRRDGAAGLAVAGL